MAKRYHDSNGMISENRSERANLPQGVIMKDYSSEGSFLPDGYPGYGPAIVDKQIREDGSKMKSIMDPRKI